LLPKAGIEIENEDKDKKKQDEIFKKKI